jgi:hypothetical protein
MKKGLFNYVKSLTNKLLPNPLPFKAIQSKSLQHIKEDLKQKTDSLKDISPTLETTSLIPKPLSTLEFLEPKPLSSIINSSTYIPPPLPLETKTLFLPKENKLSALSGLASLQETFKLKLKTDLLLNITFSKFLLLEKAKILIYLFDKPYKEEEFIFKLFKCFSLIVGNETLSKNKLLENIYHTKYVSTIQHMLIILLHKRQFNISSLITSKFVDFSHYKMIPISVIIENFVFYEITKEFQISNSVFNIKAIDHTNHLLEDPFDIYKRYESNEQISQIHSDFLLYKLIADKDGITEIVRFYRDIKADYHGTSTGHFTIIPFLYTNVKVANQYMNNPISFLKEKISKNSHYKSVFQDDLDALINIKQEVKTSKADIKKIIINFNQKLLSMSLNQIYINANINVTIACDVEIDNDFQQHTLPLILKELEEYPNLFDIDDIFPKNNKIKINAYERKIHEIINKIIPKELQDNIRNNYNKYIEDDTK